MLYFKKSQPTPPCLEIEKDKANGDYKCGDVLIRVKNDFKNKCYICEWAMPPSINVEHFRPHRGDKELKFSWKNLFWSCSHCNNTKQVDFDDILDCTNIQDQIETRLRYEFKPFPFEKVKIESLDEDPSTIRTKDLIEAVFNGTTPLKMIESANIRDALLKDVREFQDYLIEYFKETCDDVDREYYRRKIKGHLHAGSSFVSFKRWIIRENEELFKKFGQYFSEVEMPS